MANARRHRDDNPDPITGAPGAHPVGTGLGAAAGGVIAGAAAGTVTGPVGAVAGAAVGAIVGGLAGKGVAEGVNPSDEDAYWRANFEREPYYLAGYGFDDYAPAYRLGYDVLQRHPGRRFEDIEASLEGDYLATRGDSRLAWKDARFATHAAWRRLRDGLPGEAIRQ